MTSWQVDSLLLAAHNIALALGAIASGMAYIAFALAVYPWIGGFGSSRNRTVKLDREEPR